jgi:hypothetical protein
MVNEVNSAGPFVHLCLEFTAPDEPAAELLCGYPFRPDY